MYMAGDLARDMDIPFSELRELGKKIGLTGLKRNTRLSYGAESDLRLEAAAEREMDVRCTYCGDWAYVDYCPSHGGSGDPEGFAFLQAELAEIEGGRL